MAMEIGDRSLIVADLELGRYLVNHGKISFCIHGTCMLPCIRPFDVVTVEVKEMSEIVVGDIVVFRRNNELFAHRAIAKGIYEGKECVITQPDRANGANDGPIFSNDILGVVIEIKRNGVSMPLHCQPLRGLNALRAVRWKWQVNYAIPVLKKSIFLIQGQRWYRRIGKTVINRMYPERRYAVRVPFNEHKSYDLYRKFPAETFDPTQLMIRGESPNRWILDVFIDDEKNPVGSSILAYHPDGCPRGSGWWLEGTFIQTKFIGLGLEVDLFHESEKILIRCGKILQQKSSLGYG